MARRHTSTEMAMPHVPGLPPPGAPVVTPAPPEDAPTQLASPYSGVRVALQHRVYREQHARMAEIAGKLARRNWPNVSAAEVTQMMLHPAMDMSDEEMERRWQEWVGVQNAPRAQGGAAS